jgi:Methyltransferase domain
MQLPVLKHWIHCFMEALGVRIEFVRTRPPSVCDSSRSGYQKRHVNFDVHTGMRILDIGSGGYPFPGATVLVDRFLEPVHRYEPLATHGKPLVVADIHSLPFPDKSFDFVYCSHVLEVVEDPLRACGEIMRVGPRGYVETPTFAKDMLFAWARGVQKWHVVAIGPHLCFFEYSERQLDGIKSTAWRDLIMGEHYHPLQDAFAANQDLFNVMFSWQDKFSVFVFCLDGSYRVLNVDTIASPDAHADVQSPASPANPTRRFS